MGLPPPIRSATRCVYFAGTAWMGNSAPQAAVGVSAKTAGKGSQLSNMDDKDPFLRHVMEDGLVKFESLTHPGLYIVVDGTQVFLNEPDGMNEMFSELPAQNGAAEPFVSLRSHAE